MPRNRQSQHSAISEDTFLRSINIQYDAAEPDRIAHFRPTSKSLVLLKALAGAAESRASLVVAPYGTGKSLTATFALQLIENRKDTKDLLLSIGQRASDVHPESGKSILSRRRSKKKGLVVALHGHCPDLPNAIRVAILDSMRRLKLTRSAKSFATANFESMEEAVALMARLREKKKSLGVDRISIIWDEFGRHLESLAREGYGDSLSEVQLLAEFSARTKTFPVTLNLLLHQGLIHYAGNLPQAIQNEWRKIEGRFETIEYLDDSNEAYRLLAEVISSRTSDLSRTKKVCSNTAEQSLALGFFSGFGKGELTDLLHRSSSVDPIALYLLPRVSARVAQNERTLFGFLFSSELDEQVRVSHVYDYFSSSMRADTSLGGTYRQWLETESALSKVESEEERNILKATCLMSLGASGARSRINRAMLEFAVAGFGDIKEVRKTVQSLIKRKLLLYRKNTDEVSTWHGTDLDLRGRLEQSIAQRASSFSLVQFLSQECPPPVWKPVQYNDKWSIRRFASGQYQTVSQLETFLNYDIIFDSLEAGEDAKILYLVAESPEQIEQATEIAQRDLKHDRLLVVIPESPLAIREAALEVACLEEMQRDQSLVHEDPMALPEIHQMSDDARDHLTRIVTRLIQPLPEAPSRWFHMGESLPIQSTQDLRAFLSQLMEHNFPKAPVIRSESLIRHRPTPVIVNARKKLLMGILERHGQEALGIQGNFPDMSMFRTILLNTGLYQSTQSGVWKYARPSALADQGLRAVWKKLEVFLTRPTKVPKSPATLLKELKEPPYGVREGLLPVLLASGLKAFPSAISITRRGEYLDDLLPSDIEQICKTPQDYWITVLDLNMKKRQYLTKLITRFDPVREHSFDTSDMIRIAFDAIESWKSNLAPAALTTKSISRPAIRLRAALHRSKDPVRLLFDELPAFAGGPIDEKTVLAISTLLEEMEQIANRYADLASDVMLRCLNPSREAGTLREMSARWTQYFSENFISALQDGIAKGFLLRLKKPYATDYQLIDSIANLLVERGLARWEDATAIAFEREFESIVRRLEDRLLSAHGEFAVDVEAAQISSLVGRRISDLYKSLAAIVGDEEAKHVLASVPDSQKGDKRGKPKGSTSKPSRRK